jgi:2-haloacid dehalogenase
MSDRDPLFPDEFANKPAAVVFDVGGVLIDWNPRHLYRKLFAGDDMAMEYFLTHICSATWNLMQDAGRTFDEGVSELIGRYPDYADLIRAFHERWEEMVPGAIEGSVEILESLKKRDVPLYSITNFSAEKFALTRRRFVFFDYFDGIVVSGKVRLIKPDPAIYLYLLSEYGLKAGNCIFIDDHPRNLDGAKAVGMHTLHFQSPEQLRSEFARLGLL